MTPLQTLGLVLFVLGAMSGNAEYIIHKLGGEGRVGVIVIALIEVLAGTFLLAAHSG